MKKKLCGLHIIGEIFGVIVVCDKFFLLFLSVYKIRFKLKQIIFKQYSLSIKRNFHKTVIIMDLDNTNKNFTDRNLRVNNKELLREIEGIKLSAVVK